MNEGAYSIAKVITPRRDVDLFGATTVRIDHIAGKGASPVPVLYLSAYVEKPDDLAARVIGALAWLDDAQAAQALQDHRHPVNDAQPPSVLAYAMPAFVEDVDYAETLFLPEDISTTDWKAWASSMVCRIVLATTSSQLAALEASNATGLKLCPYQQRGPISRALRDAYEVTHDQAAAA